MDKFVITSSQNPKVKAACALRDKRSRIETGLFLIEGYRELRRAIDAKVRLETLFVCPCFFLKDNEKSLMRDASLLGATVYEVAPALFEKLSYRDRPDGLIGIAQQMQLGLEEIKFKRPEAPFLVVAEAIEKPGNLGTILRSADAAGVDAVIVSDPCTDIYNPNVVRASVGTLFTVPVIEATGEAVLSFLKKRHIPIVAATPSADTFFTESNLKGPVAILVGTEQLGLSELWMKAATIKVKIPMNGVADSLNVSAATTLLLYEALRQRKNP